MIREEDNRLIRFLHTKGFLDTIRMERCIKNLRDHPEKNCVDLLIDTMGMDEETVAQAISDECKIPYISLTSSMISLHDPHQRRIYAEKYNAIPIIRTGVEMTVVFFSPPYKEVIESIKRQEKLFILPVVTFRSAYHSVLRRQLNEVETATVSIPSKFPIESFDVSAQTHTAKKQIPAGLPPGADVLIDEILIRAINRGATDVYFEPTGDEFRIRYNVDGSIYHALSLPEEFREPISNVLRARGKLNVFDKKKAQDGLFSAEYGGSSYSFRITTLPTNGGERFSVRIVSTAAREIQIDRLGFSPENSIKLQFLMNHSRGMVVISGPSSSGKSTTAYGMLKEQQNAQKNVITIESPIEHLLPFASQIQLDAEQRMDYASSIRSAMRQQPDILFIGEITDAEAGLAAAEAALAGTMVLTTIIAGDAVSSIPRLMQLGVPRDWLSTTLNGIIFQKLTRRICTHCRTRYTPTKQMLASAGLTPLENLITFFRGDGCSVCNGTGYHGRTAVQEVLVVDDELKDLISRSGTQSEIRALSAKKGFEHFRFDAAKKLITGTISLEDFLRVAR